MAGVAAINRIESNRIDRRYKLLNQVPYYEDKRVSYASGLYTFHVMTRVEMIYLVLAQRSTKKKLCYDFLTEVRVRVLSLSLSSFLARLPVIHLSLIHI